MKSIATTIGAMAIGASLAQAATIVNWGASGGDSNIVTANALGQTNPIPATYSSTNPISPSNGTSGYNTAASGQTRVFYGAMTTHGSTPIINNATSDNIQLVVNLGTSPATVGSMIAWKASDFLDLQTTAKLQSFTIEFQKRNNTASTTATLLLETSTGWWESVQSATHAGYSTWSVADISTLTWSPFSQFGVTGGTGSANIGDVKSVGFHFTTPAGANDWTGTQIRHVNLTAVAVPEPSSSSLLALVCFTAGFLRRRRR